MSRFFTSRIVAHGDAAPGHRILTFSLPAGLPAPLPGQFFMVGIPGGGHDPLLKRPFSLFLCEPEGHARILYRIRGRGTRLLAGLETGTTLEILGPLGTPFPTPGEKMPVIVGGGLGTVPLAELARRFSGRGLKPRIFLGGRSATELLALDLFRQADPDLNVSTDDGSFGHRGLVTEQVEAWLAALDDPAGSVCVYACGPKPMLAALSSVCGRLGVAGYVSLEEHMACGIGACMGCVTRTTDGFKRVCREGPVFSMRDVLFDIRVAGQEMTNDGQP